MERAIDRIVIALAREAARRDHAREIELRRVAAEMDLPQRRHQFGDKISYSVAVLWAAGWPAKAIAGALGLRPKQALNLAQRSVAAERASMTDGERKRLLLELQAIRYDEDGNALDGGTLPPSAFEMRPLRATQRR